jgi:dienelactone hydrolase
MKMIAAALITLTIVGSPALSAAALKVHPQTALFDQPVTIAMTGLAPDEKVTLTLTTKDAKDNVWRSRATYYSSLDGTLDLRRAAPYSGTYSGADPMGLFWSMQPSANKPKLRFSPSVPREGDVQDAKKNVYHLSASVEGKKIATTDILRQSVRPTVVMKKVRQGSLFANLYYPSDFERDGREHAAIITLGGAEGGIAAAATAGLRLASHGFVVLATAWYHIGPLPDNMVRVPVKSVEDAIAYLRNLSFVDPNSIGAWGGSWGAILALFSAAHFPQIHAVVSSVGGPIIGQGLIRQGEPPANYRPANASPFLYHGKPVPFVTYQELLKFFETHDQSLIEKAFIPIWHINGPILFVAGGDDKLEFSGIMASLAIKNLKRRHHPYPDRVLYYRNAGHLIFPGYWPTTNRAGFSKKIPVGGTPAGYARADADVGSEVVDFFRESLK